MKHASLIGSCACADTRILGLSTRPDAVPPVLLNLCVLCSVLLQVLLCDGRCQYVRNELWQRELREYLLSL